MNEFRVWVVMVMAALCVAYSGCNKPAATPAAPPTATPGASFMPTQAQPMLRTIKLWLGAEEMEAEMALTQEQQATGMMFRTNRLAENAGMLFPLPYTTQASFWMTNCPLPLAAAYIDPEGVIEEIHAFQAYDDRSVVARTANIRFVLETSEGWFARHNISTGTVVRTESGSLMDTFFGTGQRRSR